ncbi:MAG: Protein GrpE [bacterium]|nr:Protein GrpE [bacterium]
MENKQDRQPQAAPEETNGQAEPVETTPIPETGETGAVAPEPQNGSGVTPEAPAELQERFLRLAADFANYKRRNESERAEIADWARRDFALALLPILDDFGLMIEYETQHPERLAEGARLIRQKTLDLLVKHGLEKIDVLNQPYDYECCEAVLTQPVQEPALDHVVVSVMQEGYRFKGKVLRPSKVIVGQYSEPGPATSEATAEKSTEPN